VVDRPERHPGALAAQLTGAPVPAGTHPHSLLPHHTRLQQEYYEKISHACLAPNSSHQKIPGTKHKIMNVQLRGKENTIACSPFFGRI